MYNIIHITEYLCIREGDALSPVLYIVVVMDNITDKIKTSLSVQIEHI